MPVSKNRRKNTKSKTKKSSKKKAKIPESEIESKTKNRPKFKFRDLVSFSHPDATFRMVMFAPFFVAAWISKGLLLTNFSEMFIAVFLVMSVTYFGELTSSFQSLAREKKEHKAITLSILLLLVAELYLLSDPIAQLLLLVVAGSYLLLGNLRLSAPTKVLSSVGLLLVGMYSLAVLGSYIQFGEFYDSTYRVGIIGVVPGALLAAALVLRNTEVLESHGWNFSRRVKTKKGEIERPGKIMQLVSVLLILIPALPMLLAVSRLLPEPFLAYGLSVFIGTKISNKLYDGTENIHLGIVKIEHLAVLTTVIGLIAGAISSS